MHLIQIHHAVQLKTKSHEKLINRLTLHVEPTYEWMSFHFTQDTYLLFCGLQN